MISQTDFKDIFKIPHEYNVCEKTLCDYTSYVKQSYNLFKDIIGLHEQVFSLNIEVKVFHYQILVGKLEFIENSLLYNYQYFVQGYTPNSIKLGIYHYDPIKKKSKYFWELEYANHSEEMNIIDSAYVHFEKDILFKLNEKYSEYNIKLKVWIDFYEARSKGRSAIKTSGINFTKNLGIVIPEDTFSYISNGDVRQSIINQRNVWTGDLHKPIKHIIESEEN